jgi:hypothetical protein
MLRIDKACGWRPAPKGLGAGRVKCKKLREQASAGYRKQALLAGLARGGRAGAHPNAARRACAPWGKMLRKQAPGGFTLFPQAGYACGRGVGIFKEKGNFFEILAFWHFQTSPDVQ